MLGARRAAGSRVTRSRASRPSSTPRPPRRTERRRAVGARQVRLVCNATRARMDCCLESFVSGHARQGVVVHETPWEDHDVTQSFDAIVVGARCGGAPTAMLLARKGYRVL